MLQACFLISSLKFDVLWCLVVYCSNEVPDKAETVPNDEQQVSKRKKKTKDKDKDTEWVFQACYKLDL